MKERDTVILSVRIKRELYAQLGDAVKASKQPSRNAWLTWAISLGLRKHTKRTGDL